VLTPSARTLSEPPVCSSSRHDPNRATRALAELSRRAAPRPPDSRTPKATKDKWGLSWQITPRALIAALSDHDRAAAKRAFEAMMTMKKIDIAAIEAARRG
jgi:hypothetical protein